MCRLVVYRGHKKPILLASLLTRPTHSIIKQSFDCKERLVSPINGDGFGVGFYAGENEKPCVFTGTTPAWNSSNLHRLADHVVSSLIFAHVRAASRGLTTNESNCHPFAYGRYLWMHNGDIPSFAVFKRAAMLSLPQHLFDAIQGHTDSELCFMLFLMELGMGKEEGGEEEERASAEELVEAMQRTLARVAAYAKGAGDARCVLNFVLTDGDAVVATRFAGGDAPCASLYYASGSGWDEAAPGEFVMSHRERLPAAHIIASEPLTADPKDWVKIPPQSVCLITPDSDLLLFPVSLPAVTV